MIRFFDASALLKRYVREAGTAAVNRWLASETAACSRLSEAEISSALARRRREGTLESDEYERALAAIRADLMRLNVVELSPAVVAAVHPLLSRHALRAGDALQLASALVLRDRFEGEVPVEFVVYDERLHAAARAEGFHLRPNVLPKSKRRALAK